MPASSQDGGYEVTGRARIALTAALLMAAPAMLDAQDPSPVPTQMPPEVQALMMEAQQIQAQLAPLEQRVMQDPELQTEQQEVMLRVTTAMLEADPTLEAHVQRMQTLQEEAQAAQAAGDQERLGAIVGEANQIQSSVAQAQASVLQQPEMAALVRAFTQRVQNRMIAEDADAEALIRRMGEIQMELAAAAESAGQ
jgi:hypothetical protein